MLVRAMAIAIAAGISTVSNVALAREFNRWPVAHYNGNYENTRIILPNGDIRYHPTWRVVSEGLNCRSSPGTDNPQVRQFAKKDLIQADVIDGGKGRDRDSIEMDAEGKPWMRLKIDSGVCFVRANRRFIEPLRVE